MNNTKPLFFFLHDFEQALFQFPAGEGTWFKTHFNEAPHIFFFWRDLGMKFVQLAFRLVRASADIVQGNVEIIRIPAEQINRRVCLIVLITVHAGLGRSQDGSQLLLRQIDAVPQRTQLLSDFLHPYFLPLMRSIHYNPDIFICQPEDMDFCRVISNKKKK